MAILYDCNTGEIIRAATDEEEALSEERARHDGGHGALGYDAETDEVFYDQTREGRSVYVD